MPSVTAIDIELKYSKVGLGWWYPFILKCHWLTRATIGSRAQTGARETRSADDAKGRHEPLVSRPIGQTRPREGRPGAPTAAPPRRRRHRRRRRRRRRRRSAETRPGKRPPPLRQEETRRSTSGPLLMLSLLLLLLLLLVVVVDRGGRGCRQMAKESHHVRYTNTRTLLAEKTTELANWQKEWRQQTIRMVSPLQTCRSHRDSICRCRPTKKLTRSQSPTELHTHTHTHTWP